jgi:hypothetical protein
MIIKEVKASFSRTVQVKQYEPVRFYCEITAIPEPGEKTKDIYNKIQEACIRDVNAQAADMEVEKKAKTFNKMSDKALDFAKHLTPGVDHERYESSPKKDPTDNRPF